MIPAPFFQIYDYIRIQPQSRIFIGFGVVILATLAFWPDWGSFDWKYWFAPFIIQGVGLWYLFFGMFRLYREWRNTRKP